MKLTESEKLERKLMILFEYHFRNYKLDFTWGDWGSCYNDQNTYLMFLAYVAGYNKGLSKK
jgi:hypothetical protein